MREGKLAVLKISKEFVALQSDTIRHEHTLC